jgi:glycosyltransferase involved in cell wall biosynthesis
MSIRLSVCIITLNEEDNIRDCLESVRWADEIVVLDSGSEDRTRQIASEYTDRVLLREWPGHVQQKNAAVEEARGEWILALDADERCTPELAEEIRAVIDRPKRPVAYWIPRRLFYMGRWLRHGGWSPEYKVRLFRKGQARWGGVNPHDHVVTGGPRGTLNGSILHYSYRNLADQIRQTVSFTRIAADEMAAAGKRGGIHRLILHPPWAFFHRYVIRLGMLDGLPGLIMATNHAFTVFLKYARLWEKGIGEVSHGSLGHHR